ncbi:protein decapping 5-like [Rutidosis leptorrhynchoides]|uniref:protein decapping 5-like n=1 Tax=Rutidosis leptorrhynchoides TaxID=125765 RepID=UPI003A98E768
MATEGSKSSGSSADSYIGSLISLTSKSEIRYEGILYSINTEESSIGLTNVRAFGTEGRKKDGPQVMPGDKVYEYILFRGSDIKDLQVKSSQPVQPSQPINSDPAIKKSHYPRPPSTSSNLPVIASDSSSASNTTYNPHLGQAGPPFQGGVPLYQPGGNVGSWGPSPPPPNTSSSGLAMPMYWPGYYPPPNALPHMQHQSLPRPPLQQPMQYPSFNNAPPLSSGPPNTSAPSLPEYPSSLFPGPTSSAPITSNSLPGSTLPSLPSMMHNNSLNSSTLQQPHATSATVTSDLNVTVPLINPNMFSGPRFPYQNTPPPAPSVGGAPLVSTESTPSLVTPGQLLQSVPSTIVSSQSPLAGLNDVEVVSVPPVSSSPPSVPVAAPTEPSQPPLLPLPTQTQTTSKPNGSSYHNRPNYNYRGRGRGRGSGGSQPVMKFTEEFDFSAMNEKFNKDEVWGTLGKSNRSELTTDEDEIEEENDLNLPKVDVKPVYSKDDFFDSLSSNTSDRQSNYGRTRFSEQRKLDTETFGEFSNRYRGGGRGGRGPNRGGRFRGGGYYGRGGYGYVGRGRGGRNPNVNATDY